MNEIDEAVLYRAPDGTAAVDVRLEANTLWLNLNQIGLLFDRDKSVISRHLRNVFRERELDRDSVVAFFATTAADGKMHQVEYFNLDAGRAESDLAAGKCDLIAVGRPFLANPDLVERWRTNAAVNAPDMSTFYTPGPKGYTDYPALKK